MLCIIKMKSPISTLKGGRARSPCKPGKTRRGSGVCRKFRSTPAQRKRSRALAKRRSRSRKKSSRKRPSSRRSSRSPCKRGKTRRGSPSGVCRKFRSTPAQRKRSRAASKRRSRSRSRPRKSRRKSKSRPRKSKSRRRKSKSRPRKSRTKAQQAADKLRLAAFDCRALNRRNRKSVRLASPRTSANRYCLPKPRMAKCKANGRLRKAYWTEKGYYRQCKRMSAKRSALARKWGAAELKGKVREAGIVAEFMRRARIGRAARAEAAAARAEATAAAAAAAAAAPPPERFPSRM